jgi:LuxR family maltose regulon positive regulatory protein
LLEQAAAMSMLLAPQRSPFTKDVRCYRVHPLLRSFLQRRLRHERSPDALQHMHMRAAHWLAAHDMVDGMLALLLPEQASDSAYAERDAEFASDLVHALRTTTRGLSEPTAFQRWLGRLPETYIRARPRLVLEDGWGTFLFITPRSPLQIERMKAMLAAAEIRRDPQAAAYRSEAAVVDGLEAIAHGRFDLALQRYESVDADQFGAESIPMGYVHLLRAFVAPAGGCSMEGRLPDIHRAKEVFMRAGSLRGWTMAAYAESWIRRSGIELTSVLKNFELAYGSLQQHNLHDSRHAIVTYLVHADTLYYLDRIAESRQLLQRAMQLIKDHVDAPVFSYHFTLRLEMCDRASGVDAQIDDEDDATQWFASLDAFVPFVASTTAYLRVQRDCALGRTDRVLQSFAGMHVIDSDLVPNLPLLYRTSMLTHKVYGGRDADDVASALVRYHADCVQQGWALFALQARVLQLVHSLRLGADQWDLPMLDEVLETIESTGLHRLILNHPRLAPLLARSDRPIAAALLRRIGAAQPTTPFHLSQHEMRILRLLSDERSTEDIAAVLTISLATVRTHLRNIFKKMNVHTRAEAVRAASIAGILDG